MLSFSPCIDDDDDDDDEVTCGRGLLILNMQNASHMARI